VVLKILPQESRLNVFTDIESDTFSCGQQKTKIDVGPDIENTKN
jgi:hypothetical protein